MLLKKNQKYSRLFNFDSIGRDLIGDPVVKQNAGQMIDFMLEHDGRIAGHINDNVLVAEQIIAFDFDVVMPQNSTGMGIDDGQAALAGIQKGRLGAFLDNFRIGKRPLLVFFAGFFITGHYNRNHLFGNAKLNGGQANGRGQIFLFAQFIVLAVFDILKHRRKQFTVFFA